MQNKELNNLKKKFMEKDGVLHFLSAIKDIRSH